MEKREVASRSQHSPIADPTLTVMSAADLNGDGLRDLLAAGDAGLAIVWNTLLGFVSALSMITRLEPPEGLDENTLAQVVYTFTVMDLEGTQTRISSSRSSAVRTRGGAMTATRRSRT